MLARLWYVIAGAWALLLVAIAATDKSDSPPAAMFWVIAFGPFLVPYVLRRLVVFVVFGARPQLLPRAPRP